jgi:SpoIID/LytB domain protein
VTVDGITGAFTWIEVRPESTSGRVAATLRATSSSSVYKSEYWGKVRVEAIGTKSLRVFNTLQLERYVRSVAEIDPGWANARLTAQYAPEAVKAQQVAARTYAVRHSGDAYLYDNTLDQVYLGYTWEAANPGVKAAVEATAGQVLTRNGAAISALYCASSGGYLSDTAWSDSGSPSYLVAKADPWSLKAPISPWKVNPGLGWTRSFSPATLTTKLKSVANVGTITNVEIVSRDTSDPDSHAVKVRITGASGSTTIAARVFRAKLGLPSTLILSLTMPDVPANGATRYQQTDSHLDWAGSWETFKTEGASAGSYRRAAAKGASVTATFKGTYLAWIATEGKTLGKAYVSVDGKAAVKIDLSATATAYRQKVWDTGTLKSGVHTVKIWWYPSNKAGRFISIDAFEVKGTLR